MIEGHELYLRTRHGRFDLHWVDPFGGETEEQVGEDKIVAPLPGTVVALLAEEGATPGEGRGDPDAGSHEDGADPARALCRRAEEASSARSAISLAKASSLPEVEAAPVMSDRSSSIDR